MPIPKIILIVCVLLLITSANLNVRAQDADKKGSTVDAWRQAAPEAEQISETPPVAAVEESEDNVEAEEAALTEKRILDLGLRFMEALKQRDAVALKHLLADDFTVAGANMTEAQADKIRYINWALKNLELKSYSLEKTAVRVYGATAVATTRYKQQALVAGSPADGDFIATQVWVKREKCWQAVSHHVSQLPKP